MAKYSDGTDKPAWSEDGAALAISNYCDGKLDQELAALRKENLRLRALLVPSVRVATA